MIRLRRTTPRPLLVGAVALAGALAVSSCSTVTSDAARVGDASLSRSDFEAVLSGLGEAFRAYHLVGMALVLIGLIAATAPPEIRDLARRHLRLPLRSG